MSVIIYSITCCPKPVFFLLLNTKDDILKNVGHQTVAGPHRGGLTHLAKVGDCLGPPKAKGPLKCFSYTRCALSAEMQIVAVHSIYYHDNCLRANVLLVYPACSK